MIGGEEGWRPFQAYGHAERVFDVRFHPTDSSIIASASEDCSIRIWREIPETGTYQQVEGRLSLNPPLSIPWHIPWYICPPTPAPPQVQCLYGHQAEVLRLAWSSGGKLLASGQA